MMRAIIRYFLIYLALTSNVHAIVLGTIDEDNIYSSVGYTLTSGGGLGSVVALDPYWVLTAAHVVESDPALLVMGDSFTGAEGAYIFFEEVITHPDYVSGEFHDDLALVKLSAIDPIIPTPGSIDASFATLSNVSLSSGLPATATLTGYGVTSVGGTLDPDEPILRRYGVATTDPFGPPTPSFDPGFPYDCSLAMWLCTYSTTGGAPGDSGGAMWLDYGGGEMVAGITSFIFDESDLLDPPGVPDWSDGYWTVGTSTAYYEDWITSYVPTAMFGSSPVPIPASVWLFGSGLLGLVGIARRKKAA
jgi:secreted trypsin-like serine protease